MAKTTARNGPVLSEASPRKPCLPPFLLRQRSGTVRGDGARDSQQPARAQARGVTAFASRAAGKGGGSCQASGRGPRSSRGQLPTVQIPRDSVSTLISWYKMPTSGKTWTVPDDGASVYRSRRPPGSESRPPETPQDPIATEEGRGGGPRERDGAIWSTPEAPSKERAAEQAAARGAGRPVHGLPHHLARAGTARSNVLPNRDFERIPRGAYDHRVSGRAPPRCRRRAAELACPPRIRTGTVGKR